jgi:hypothetical protein
MELTKEEKAIHWAYLVTFSSAQGQIVLDDMRKSYQKAFDEDRFNDTGHMIQRATEFNVIKKIERIMARAAEEIQRTEGVVPATTPKVEKEGDDEWQ